MSTADRLLLFLATALTVAVAVAQCPAHADRRRQWTTYGSAPWPEWDKTVSDPPLVTDFPTAGWPTDYGRICVTFTSSPDNEHRAIIDGRADADDPRPYLAVVNDNRIRFGIQTVGSIAGGQVVAGKAHTACVDRTLGTTRLYLDGVQVGSSATLPAWNWPPTVRLGSRYGDADPLGGQVYDLRWRGLRLHCNMRSGTCSDGRQITTTRATPVPCEVSPGVWEIIPADQGCYSVRGLEAWAATTSYLSWGAELDRSPWGGQATATKDGANYLVCGETGGAFRQQLASEAGGVVRAAACRVRAGTSNSIRLLAADVSSGGVNFDYTLTDAWQTVTATTTIVEGGGVAGVRLHPSRAGAGCVEVAGCWSTKSNTPGRACWGGEAPVTCARDFHRLPATGLPTSRGEISWVMRLERVPGGGDTLRGILWADGAPTPNRLSLTEGGAIRVYTGETAYVTGPLSWEPGRSYTIQLIMDEDEWRVVRDGALVGSTPPLGLMDWRATVRLGDLLDGSISSLRVRSFE